jgi:protein TonB
MALFAHVGGAIALLSERAHVEPGRSAPAIMLELAPIAGAPAIEQTDSIPGPVQTQTDATPSPEPPELVEESTPEAVEETKALAIERPKEPKREDAPVEQKVAELTDEQTPDVPPAPRPEVALALPASTPEVKLDPKPHPKAAEPQPKKKNKDRKRMRSALATTAPAATQEVAERPSAPAPGHAGQNNNSLPNWKSMLAAHLQRHKRYPVEAQSRGDQGTALLRFTVDRNGNVMSSGLARSSGVPVLDSETLALIRRASPLPAAPSDVTGSQFSFSVPIVFNMR